MPTGYQGTKAPHGTASRYISFACRCEECRDAHRRYYGQRKMEDYLAEIEPDHGTESRYSSERFKCRCEDCSKAANLARNERRKRPNVAVHGKYTGYKNGCRCDECRAAYNVWSKLYKRKRRAAA